MQAEKVQIVKAVLEIVGHESGMDVRYDYSGRGMYGQQCPAIVTSDVWGAVLTLINAIEHVIQRDDERLRVSQVLGWFEYRTDSMGLDTVLYFPNIKLD